MDEEGAKVSAGKPLVYTFGVQLGRSHASIPNQRTELVRGMLVVRKPPGGRHGSVTINLALRIGNHVERTGGGQVFAAETGFTLSHGPDTVRAPDIAFVRRERLPDPIPVRFPDLAPDLVVEVLSPGDRAGEILARSLASIL